MNSKIKNSIYNFLDKYTGGKGIQIVKGVSLHNLGNYEPISVHHVKTGDGLTIFQVINNGYYFICPLAKILCGFFSISLDLSRDIIVEWFFNRNNIDEKDILSLVKKDES